MVERCPEAAIGSLPWQPDAIAMREWRVAGTALQCDATARRTDRDAGRFDSYSGALR